MLPLPRIPIASSVGAALLAVVLVSGAAAQVAESGLGFGPPGSGGGPAE